jgi:tetratricopeptide (TPR) repeat protein
MLFVAAACVFPAARADAQAAADKAKGKPAPGPADELAQKAVAEAQKENYEEALNLFRQAYRIDHSPRWLYDMGVLHDKLAECDDAAFFYRAALWGKGVLPQDQDAVDNRLGVLEDECHFKKRHATDADRHARAARYVGFKLCFLAQSILTKIETPAEKKQIDQCLADEAKP